MRSDFGTVRERIGFLVVFRWTANSVHQFREPAVKVSVEFDAIRARDIIMRQLMSWALVSSTHWFSTSRLCLRIHDGLRKHAR